MDIAPKGTVSSLTKFDYLWCRIGLASSVLADRYSYGISQNDTKEMRFPEFMRSAGLASNDRPLAEVAGFEPTNTGVIVPEGRFELTIHYRSCLTALLELLRQVPGLTAWLHLYLKIVSLITSLELL